MGSAGFEPATSAMSRRRHNQLDHEPCSKAIGPIYNKPIVRQITLIFRSERQFVGTKHATSNCLS